ncbi:P-loop containing nucleoside triphosphate hydrolase protein [Dichotomocladium elegans]|nr:P-loop containing nucleoside triphosphate hydrolase protein [Dichotomocladium elegans]
MASPATVPILVLMGTAGCGKSTIAEHIQGLLGCEYIEGDDMHPDANVQKMSRGEALNDDDRWPWLRAITKALTEKATKLLAEDTTSTRRAVLLTCSSLRKSYRDILRQVPTNVAKVTFVYLKGSRELLLERISARKGHFMAATMLDSQINSLEEPNPEEESVIVADIRKDPPTLARWIVDEAIKEKIVYFAL